MAKQDSSKTVFLALSVNFFIGLIKSFVAFITSSSAMFSEAVHSFVDSFNQFLLWFGIKQTKKVILNFIHLEEDEKSTFGH
jgi:divalent metal cation (Fe/Co/Zn/Cd) transporter